jgi:hypothetical protein
VVFVASTIVPRQLLGLVVASIAVAGCFSTATVVKVRADGSGTIELTTTLRKAALIRLDAFTAVAGDRQKTPKLNEWLPESDARAAASRLGSDVRYVSTRATDTADTLGRVTIYEFADIRRVMLEPIPVVPGAGFGADARLDGEHRFTFDLVEEQDNRRTLIARLPDARIEYSGVEIYAQRLERPNPEDEALLRALLAGLRLEVTVEPELSIVGANTLHRDGRRVTLVAIDAERLAFDEQVEKRLLLQPGSLDELRYRLHDLPGVIVGLDREVRIELAPR